MASRIAGITIEIGAETTKLTNALKGVDKQIKSTQNALKDIDKLLKLDPKNTELLTQKQKQLSEQIKTTKDRLNTLKDAVKGIKEGTPEYDALQREIIETEQKLKSLEKEYKDFGSVAKQQTKAAGEEMQKFGSNLTQVGSAVQSVGSDLTKYVTAPIVGIGTASVYTAATFDASMSKVKALSGATEDELASLEAKAREMGASTKYSASESADAFSYMALAGWDTYEMLAGIEPVLNLAAAADMDLARTSDIVTDNLTAFGLGADEAERFTNKMAYAMANSNTDVEQLGEAFKNSAATAHSMNFTVDEVTATLMTMADAGIKGSSAGTALNAIMTRLATDTKGCASELAKYGVEVYDAEGNMNTLTDILEGVRGVWNGLTMEEQANLAKSIAGQSHYSELQTIMAGLAEGTDGASSSFSRNAEALAMCDDAAKEMASTMQDNLNGELTTLKSMLEEAAISIGKVLMPTIRSIVDRIKEWTDKFNSLDDRTKKVIITIAMIVAAIGPVVLIIGTVIMTIGTLITTIGTIMSVTGLALSTIALIPAVIMGVVAVIIICIMYWDEIKAKMLEVANAIKDAVVREFNNAKDTILNIVNALKSGLSAIWDAIRNTAANAMDRVKDALTRPFETAKNVIKGIVDTIKGFFNFTVSAPNIPMPHFSISPSGWKIGDLMKGSIPTLGINWYAKAMDNAMVLSNPSIFGMAGGKLLGGGEAGREVVSGEAHLIGLINQSVNDALGYRLDNMIHLLSENADKQIVLDSGALVGGLAPRMDSKLGNMTSLKKRGVATW